MVATSQFSAQMLERKLVKSNFKNFFSVVMMAIVDAAARFMWVSVGFPGNSHDSIIFQSTQLWSDITEKKVIPEISQNIQGTDIYPRGFSFTFSYLVDETLLQCCSEC